MFPKDAADEILNNIEKNKSNNQGSFLKSFSFDFDDKEFIVKDGLPILIDGVEAVKQWIIKFLNTDIDTLDIYKGYPFGISIKKLFGQKYLNNGFAEAELERQIREGFTLCPGINKVTSFKAEKGEGVLKITVKVLLNSGASTAITESISI